MEVTFADEPLAGGGVYRRYSDGVEEWRWLDPDGIVWWRDNRQRHGTDEPLGTRLIKRTHLDGFVRYGRDASFGWTIWSDGQRTLNLTAAPTGIAAMLIGVGSWALLGVLPDPPRSLTPSEEDRLRRGRRRPGQRRRDDDDDFVKAGDDRRRDDHADDFG